MLTSDAAMKTCPFKSNMVHETSPFQDIPGMTVQGWFYCNNVSCMSWEIDPIDNQKGFCKLIEAQTPLGY